MPSDAWKLARAASRAAASSRAAAAAAAAAAASRDSPVATAAASRGSAVAAAHSRGGVNRPPSRYSLVRDASSAAPPSTRPSKFNDEEAYLPIQEAYRFFSNRRPPGEPIFNMDIRSDKECMPFDVEDLKSEQTLWDLYNRWCSYFNVVRSSVEKGYRFNIFKEKVHFIYKLKGADPKNLVLNHLCDVSVDELCPPKFRRRY